MKKSAPVLLALAVLAFAAGLVFLFVARRGVLPSITQLPGGTVNPIIPPVVSQSADLSPLRSRASAVRSGSEARPVTEAL